MRLRTALLVILVVALGLLSAFPADAQVFKCLPTCSSTDARFLAIANGANFKTLSDPSLDLEISVPAGTTTFTVGVFDGDSRGTSGGVAHWDSGSLATYSYTLYADPNRDHSTSTVVPLSGSSSVLSTAMPDNDWIDFNVTTSAAAQSPSGNYYYLLRIQLQTTTVNTLNAFKVRTGGANVGGSSLFPAPKPFSYISNWFSNADLAIVYPNYPSSTTPANYDGFFNFYFDAPVSQHDITVWDGDFDHGKFDGTDADTDDPDTPNAPFLPPWATADARSEGVAAGTSPSTGTPPDDLNPTPLGVNGPFTLKPPSVRYDLIFPDGRTFANDNPSGNQEWEQFKISTDPFNRSLMDYSTTAPLPAGTYRMRIQGVDMLNLNAILLPGRALCVDASGVPCKPLRPFLLGDTVFSDTNGNGFQDPGEPGIPNVAMELLDQSGNTVATALTDADGHYLFEVEALTYTAKVSQVNFSSEGGALNECNLTTTQTCTANIVNDNVLTCDFGCRKPDSIGDRVWNDVNGNGVQDPGEPGINFVTVNLLDSDGNFVDTTQTAGDGNYTFANVAPGTYTVSIDDTSLPGGATPTYDLDGIATPNTAAVTLTAGNSRTDVDFGYRGNASVGDRVWNDRNGNGLQDAGEPGLNGVTVQIYDSSGNLVDTQVTSGDGNYTFSHLFEDEYTVQVVHSTVPAGYVQTYDLDGLATPDSAVVIVLAGSTHTEVDFGYRSTATGSVGDRVWLDSNGNGAQDAGEPGLNGVTVQLLDAANNVLATATTSGDGNYTFSGLAAGNYSVRTSNLPAGVAPTYDLDGIATPNVASFSLANGQTRTDVDFGYQGTASVGDRVWLDSNGNQAQDAGEPGLNGVTVELLDASNNVVGTATTSGDGNYTFSHLMGGNYSVRTSNLPAGVAPTYDLDGIATPNVASFTLAGGANRTDVDFGYRGTASVGDRVWLDSNGNGAQDTGEPGLNGVTVELLDAGNNVVGTATTSGDGNYTFSHLMGGNYSVRTSNLPAGVTPTFDLDGIATPNVASFTLAPGANRTDVDFGYRGTASVGDRVWLDSNADGVQDPGETGINNVTVELLDASNNVVGTTTTSGDGNYTFSNLMAGNYSVRIVAASLPAGVTPTFDLDGIATPNIAAFSLAAGASRTDVDFGYAGTGSIGDRLWLDTNGDGVQDAGEVGINGTTVQLLDGGGNVIGTTTTAGDGIYHFNNLTPGTYSVRIVPTTLPAGVTPTFDLDGIATPNIATFTLAAGASRTDVDFGYRGTASVGDRVWLDSNANGAQDAGETGINGVTVQLLDAGNNVLATAVTAGDGNYTFGNLLGGAYSVRVVTSTLPPGLAPTFDLDGVSTPNIATFTLNAGASRTDVDFGYAGTASVGDRVWTDTNGDGVQDPGEPGINGVTVQLLDASNNVVATTTTAGDGNYTFSNLLGGNYSVQIVAASLPAGLAPTYDLDGIATPNVASFTLAASTNRTDVDFGYRGTASVGDRVWVDTNGDGIQDPGEPGLNGVTLELLDASNNVAATTTSGGNGDYTFANLLGGNYSVRIVAASLPAGVVPTFDLDGIGTPNIASFTLADGANRTDVDFGYRGTASVGDRVWLDLNNNGAQDAGEPGINGATVQLLDASNNVVATITTSGDGNYTFSGLMAGSYSVRVDSTTLPAGVTPTFDLDGIATPNIAAFTLGGGQNRTDVDFGYGGTGSIGDRLWLDTNGDGIQDPGEVGINGTTVQLLDGGGNVIGTTTTAGDGTYHFDNLVAGTYSVRVIPTTLPAGVAPTFDLDGIGTPNVATFVLNAGASRTDVDFGYRGTASVGDRVWLDSNANGFQDVGEAGINGVTVQLLDNGGNVIATTVTAGDGNYTFANLLGGTYSVRVVAASLPAGLGATFDLDGIGTPNIATFVLNAGASRTDVDFGYVGTASIGNRVWIDTNGNGAQDPGEAGINGITVQLLDGGGNVLATQVTAGDGNYTFGNLTAGNYSVRVDSTTLPPGLTPTYDLDGIATPHVASLTLAAGANRTDVNFGYRGTASVGDRVWIDTNGDGIQDPGETGINGVTVDLLDASNTVVASTTTSGDGNYTFANLVAGNYSVRINAASLPAGVAPTYDLDGIATPHIASFALVAGANRTDVDFGYQGTGSIGDRVWLDANGNGAQDPGETGINGVTVQLLDASNSVVASTTTSGDGSYTFAHLMAGNYSVRIVVSTLPAGVAPTFDLDGIATPHVASLTLAAGANRTDVDFGYRGTASVGDRVWLDSNANGVQDAGESGINGVTVELLNASNTVVGSTTTSGDGSYTFSNLMGGNYSVRIVAGTLPPGLAPSYDLDGIATPNIAAFTLAGGANRTDVDFGYRGSGSVGDRLWLDTNGNGVQDAGEAGINGTTVQLLDSHGMVIATTTSAGDGNYQFNNLTPGDYSVRIVPSTLPAGVSPTYDLDGIATPNIATFNLAPAASRSDVDFGYRGTAAVGDRVWLDSNGNGVQDAGETGINAVTVQLLDGSGNVIATDTTAGDGNYQFSNLLGGTYSVRVVAATLPAGLAPTFDLDGIGTPNIATFTLGAAASRSDVDFGYRGTASVGDRVWNDANGNGVQEAGEAGLNGVTVQLLDGGGNVVATATTAGDGNYTFSNLTPGSYSVRVVSSTLPAGMVPTYDLDGIATPNIATFTLAAGAARTDVDFGYKTPVVVQPVNPIFECVAPNADGTYTAYFGYLNPNSSSITIPIGSGNMFSPAPADRGQPTTFNPGRTPFWPNAAFSVVFDGNNLVWTLNGLTATASRNSTPCSNHVFINKKWLDAQGQVLAQPPANLPANFSITATSTLGTATCTYPVGSTTLTCVYQNNPPATDNNGLWVPVGTTYTVTEANLPTGAAAAGGTGPYTLPNSTCVPGRNGQQSNCTHTVTNFAKAEGCAVPAISDPNFNNGPNGHSFWLPGIGTDFVFTPNPGSFVTNGNGTATLTGTVHSKSSFNNGFTVSVTFTGYQSTIPPGSPKEELFPQSYVPNGPIDPSTWSYYTGYTGTLTGTGNYAGAVINIALTGPAFQVGVGANGKNANYGASGWFLWNVVHQPASGPALQTTGQGDINIDLIDCGTTSSVGDRVWSDTNGNGVQDAGEAGINGVTVQLLDGGGNVVGTTTTAGDGNYTFAGLVAGTYSVRVVTGSLPAGVTPTFDLDGVATPNVATFNLTANTNRTDVDFGYRTNGSVGDRLWFDANANGVQDAGETGINGATVQLLDGGGNVLASATTAGDGNYTFSNLLPGTYSVRVVTSTLPAGLAPSFDLDGIATANIATFTLASGANRTDVDFGYKGSASVGDRLWLDANANGAQDAGEVGINGATVQLLDGGGNVVATTTTTGDGNYTFNNLLAGTYSVRVVSSTLPAGVTPSYDLDGIATPNVATFSLTAVAHRTDVDFGYKGTASVGDRLWIDANGNGVQDTGETGINGATVQLLDTGGNVLATATTSGNGNYTFSNLLAGTYSVRVVSSTLPAGVTPTFDLDGIATPNVATFSLAAGVSRTDVDFGYRGTSSVGDRVWLDANANGGQDTGEAGINGVTVQLLDSGGNVLATTTTAGNGNYTFSNLMAGNYSVKVVSTTLPAGLAPSYDLDGIATPHIASFSLAAATARTDVDFGYKGTASVGDRVWLDVNGNGIQDAGETGINGVTVQLLDASSNVIATATTSGNGNYTFSNLLAGSYSVKVVASTLPAGLFPTFDLDGIVTPNLASFTLAAAQVRTDVDFGYEQNACAIRAGLDPVYGPSSGGQAFWFPGIVTDLVFTPNPGSFVMSTNGTATLTGTLKSISDPNKVFTVTVNFSGYTTTTPAGSPKKELQSKAYVENGGPIDPSKWTYYTSFTGTLTGAGTYAGATITITNTGPAFQVGVGANGKNLNFGGSGWYLWTVTHQPTSGGSIQTNGQGDINIDLIDCHNAASVGDRVWLDANGNGVQDAGETGINGVTVQLLDSSGTAIASAITAGDGNYTFSNLLGGTYSVRVVTSTLPAGVGPTYDLDGIATPNVATFTVASGSSRTDVDFGYRGNLSIGDRVWRDANANGLQDTFETGINGVTVQLLNSGGTVIATTTTSGNGNYTFSNLMAGIYTVRIVTSTLGAATFTETYDLDGVATANQATVNLTASRTDVDFGYHFPSPTAGGTGTLGYWKTHPEAWPIQSITIGGITYTRDQAIVWLGTPVRGDESIALFHQLVPAELNAIMSNNISCIFPIIQAADAWMAQHPVGSGVSTSSTIGQQGNALEVQLDSYNNGNLCAPHRN
ncbi:MAG TPA: SdrD B-like domain-containing protein [Thermoanaerobaculia bacterium]|nr:SdrD B-like domain-containing protein [Thermoanaerobaculia bacterium]